MQFSKILVVAALFGLATYDNQVNAIKISSEIRIEDFNGADEDEIMDKVFSKYSTEGKDHNGVKNGVKILMKATAPKACGVILEATHKLAGKQVPGYMKANFEKAWEKFDINNDGFIKAEETHTFMRSLMGKLNKFALAPGSLSDIGTGSDVNTDSKSAKKSKPAPKKEAKKETKKPAKKVEKKKEEDEDADAAAEEPKAEEEPAADDNTETGDDVSLD